MSCICVLRPDARKQHAFAEEILKAEGIFFFRGCDLDQRDFRSWKQSSLIVLLSGHYGPEASRFLLDYVRDGGAIVAFCPSGPFPGLLQLAEGASLTDALVHVLKDSGLPTSPEDLLCPGQSSKIISGEGEVWAELRSAGGDSSGPGLLFLRIGKGRVVLFAYDPVAAVIGLRHGSGRFDQHPEIEKHNILGPRHINSFVGLAEKYSKTVPLADLHQDIVRDVLLRCLSEWHPLPRLWYFPDEAKSLFFLKVDGCGEKGLDQQIELVEQYQGKVSFYRPRHSMYSGDLIRSWRRRGHGMSMELEINEVTYGRAMTEIDGPAYDRIRAIAEDHGRAFKEECGFEPCSICIHSSQWTGAPMARILIERNWYMGTHFCSHDPRMNRETFGIYTITSTLPMRWYDYQEGLMDFFLQPAQSDESQSIGDGPKRIGFTQEEYAGHIKRSLGESHRMYHGVHIANFHPVSVVSPPDPSYPWNARRAFKDILGYTQESGIPGWGLESWCAFVRGRDAVRIGRIEKNDGKTTVEIVSALDVDGLTILLVGASSSIRAYREGRELSVKEGTFEGKSQRYVIMSLIAGQETMLYLVEPAGVGERDT